jgi:hypothetical protein
MPDKAQARSHDLLCMIHGKTLKIQEYLNSGWQDGLGIILRLFAEGNRLLTNCENFLTEDSTLFLTVVRREVVENANGPRANPVEGHKVQ